MKTIRKTYLVPEGMIEKINQLKEKLCVKYELDVIMQAVNLLYKEEKIEKPAYAIARLQSSERSARPAEIKAEEKLSIEEAKIKLKEEKKAQELADRIENGSQICSMMGGEEYIETSSNGNKFRKCKYRQYQYLNPKNCLSHEKTEYLEDLTEEEAEKQYWNVSTNEREDPLRVIETYKAIKK